MKNILKYLPFIIIGIVIGYFLPTIKFKEKIDYNINYKVFSGRYFLKYSDIPCNPITPNFENSVKEYLDTLGSILKLKSNVEPIQSFKILNNLSLGISKSDFISQISMKSKVDKKILYNVNYKYFPVFENDTLCAIISYIDKLSPIEIYCILNENFGKSKYAGFFLTNNFEAKFVIGNLLVSQTDNIISFIDLNKINKINYEKINEIIPSIFFEDDEEVIMNNYVQEDSIITDKSESDYKEISYLIIILSILTIVIFIVRNKLYKF